MMKWSKVIGVWFCFIPLAILNGGLREYVWHRFLSESTALALSGVLLAGLIYVVTFLLLPPIKDLTKKDCILVGGLWMCLTVCFEFGLGLSSGSSWKELCQAYNPMTGNLWILVLLSTLCSPMLVYKNFKK